MRPCRKDWNSVKGKDSEDPATAMTVNHRQTCGSTTHDTHIKPTLFVNMNFDAHIGIRSHPKTQH